MTYDVSAQHMLEDLELSAEYQKDAIQKARDRRRRIHGPYWSGDWNASDRPALSDFDPENHGYEMMRLMMPRLAGNVPVIELDSNRPEPEASEIAALEFAINRWVIDTNYRSTRQLLAADYMIAWSVSICGLAPRPGLRIASDPVLWPFMKRLPFKFFRFDPAASFMSPGIGDARWAAHRMVRDKMSVLREAKAHPELGWDVKALESLASDVGFDETDDAIRARVSRRELVYWCFWVPEHELDRFPDGREGRPTREMGFNGTVFYLSVGTGGSEGKGSPNAQFIRRPQPFFGPRWGPYNVSGYMPVSDAAIPLSSLAATEQQARALNTLVRSQIRSDENYKRVLLVDSKHKRLAQLVKSARHDFVIPVHNLGRNEAIAFEVGGSTPQMLQGIQLRMDALNRMSGRGSAQRGFAAGEGTATENSIANEASEISVQFEIERFRMGEEQGIRTILYYLYATDEAVMPLGSEAAAFFEMTQPIFMGGRFGEGSGVDFDSLAARIRTQSEGSALQQKLGVLGSVPEVASAMVSMPHVEWRRWATAMGQATRYEEYPELFNWRLLGVLHGMQLAGQPLPGEPDPRMEQPRMGRDVGAARTAQRTMAIPGASPTISSGMAAPSGSASAGGTTRSMSPRNGTARPGGGSGRTAIRAPRQGGRLRT